MFSTPIPTTSSSFNTNYNSYHTYSDTSFASIFRYSSLPADEINDINDNYYRFRSNDRIEKETFSQIILRQLILSFAFLIILFTLPISIWFTLKRVKPLERCIVYRLGKRLPIKGPGLIIVIPLVDVIDYIDLNPHRFNVIEKDQMLTTDGSLIEIVDFIVEITVSNVIRTSTQMQNSRSNVEQFIQLSFVNTIGGIHVEDLERKMEFIIKQYMETCNSYINKWGWSVVVIQLPTMKVLSRAEPVNHVVKALKGYFGISDGQANNLVNYSSSESANQPKSNPDDEVLNKLQSMANSYRYLSMLGVNCVTISLEIQEDSSCSYFQFNPGTGDVIRVANLQPDEKSQIIVKSTTWLNFNEAVDQKDISKVQIINNLM
ncbi:uncharacterized protein LOC128391930 [Panonychus citri]|uniref:uncharacterized protein LOC128391930 n=1 Tax=Panonychus citri TaxID=50023 RepID=UPI002307AD7E|nr:uncharacterized protein LOC128391930 [Panonychus citri]